MRKLIDQSQVDFRSIEAERVLEKVTKENVKCKESKIFYKVGLSTDGLLAHDQKKSEASKFTRKALKDLLQVHVQFSFEEGRKQGTGVK